MTGGTEARASKRRRLQGRATPNSKPTSCSTSPSLSSSASPSPSPRSSPRAESPVGQVATSAAGSVTAPATSSSSHERLAAHQRDASASAGPRSGGGGAIKQHQCPQCPKTFARHEHMARHLLATHSSETLYECDECGKRFRRSDVLQRHQRLHLARIERLLDSTDLSQRQQSALVRVQAACLRCSSKKLKCDALRPSCSRCARTSTAVCEYARQDSPGPSTHTARQPSRGTLIRPTQASMSSESIPEARQEVSVDSAGGRDDEGDGQGRSFGDSISGEGGRGERRTRFRLSNSCSPGRERSLVVPAGTTAASSTSFNGFSLQTLPAPISPTTALPTKQGHSVPDALAPITLAQNRSNAPISFVPPSEQQLRLTTSQPAPVAGPCRQSRSSLSVAAAATSGLEPDLTSLEDKTLNDLLGWLDGPANVDALHQGQIDWAFGDSPDASSGLPGGCGDVGAFNWDQVKFLADLPGQGGTPHPAPPPPPMMSDSTLLMPFCALGEGPSALLATNQRHLRSQAAPRSPLDVLSAAAQLHDQEPRPDGEHYYHAHSEAMQSNGARPQTQHPLACSERGSSSATAAAEKAAPIGERESRAAVVVDDAVSRHISATGGRSRWNSPEPADEDVVAHDSDQSMDPTTAASRARDRDGQAARTEGHSTALHHDHSIDQQRQSTQRNQQGGQGRPPRAARSMWPNRWNPELRETVIPHFTFVTASEEHLMAEDMAHVPAITSAAIVRMAEYLRLAAFSSEEERRMAQAFESVNVQTLNIYLQLFFHHFYAFFPFIHRATFSPDRCDPRLLAALYSVGAFFSEVPGSRNSGIYLASLAQNSLGQATHLNPELARFTSSFQTFLLVFLIWRSIGAPARQEHAEAFRSTYTTMIRRTRLLEDLTPPDLPPTASLEERWMAWIAWEGGRRTAWSVFVSETEMTSAWALPSAFVADEIKGQLPLDDRLWEARSASDWARVAATLAGQGGGDLLSAPQRDGASLGMPRQLTVGEACRAISDEARKEPCVDGRGDDAGGDLGRLAQLSPLSRLCVASALYLSTIHTLRMATFCSSMFGNREAVHERIRRILDSAACLLGANQGQDVRAELLLHATQLFHLVPLETLQTLSCRRGPKRMATVRKLLAQELRHGSPWKVPLIIRHAGQVLRLAKQSLKRTPTEGIYLFYACVSLHAVSILALQQGEGVGLADAVAGVKGVPQRVVRISTSGGAGSSDGRMVDAAQSSSRSAWNDEPGVVESRTSLFGPISSPASTPRSQIHRIAMASTTPSADAQNGLDVVAAAGACHAANNSSTVYILESVGNLAHPLAARRILSLVARWLRDNDGLGVWPLSRSLAKILDSLSSVTGNGTPPSSRGEDAI